MNHLKEGQEGKSMSNEIRSDGSSSPMPHTIITGGSVQYIQLQEPHPVGGSDHRVREPLSNINSRFPNDRALVLEVPQPQPLPQRYDDQFMQNPLVNGVRVPQYHQAVKQNEMLMHSSAQFRDHTFHLPQVSSTTYQYQHCIMPQQLQPWPSSFGPSPRIGMFGPHPEIRGPQILNQAQGQPLFKHPGFYSPQGYALQARLPIANIIGQRGQSGKHVVPVPVLDGLPHQPQHPALVQQSKREKKVLPIVDPSSGRTILTAKRDATSSNTPLKPIEATNITATPLDGTGNLFGDFKDVPFMVNNTQEVQVASEASTSPMTGLVSKSGKLGLDSPTTSPKNSTDNLKSRAAREEFYKKITQASDSKVGKIRTASRTNSYELIRGGDTSSSISQRGRVIKSTCSTPEKQGLGLDQLDSGPSSRSSIVLPTSITSSISGMASADQADLQPDFSSEEVIVIPPIKTYEEYQQAFDLLETLMLSDLKINFNVFTRPMYYNTLLEQDQSSEATGDIRSVQGKLSIIRKNVYYLARRTKDLLNLLAQFVQFGVLTLDDRDEIMLQKYGLSKTVFMFMTIISKDSSKFPIFHEVLRITGNEDIAKLLDANLGDEATNGSYDGTDMMDVSSEKLAIVEKLEPNLTGMKTIKPDLSGLSWSCPHCTFLNTTAGDICAICNYSMTFKSDENHQHSYMCDVCTLINEPGVNICEACESPLGDLPKDNFGESSACNP